MNGANCTRSAAAPADRMISASGSAIQAPESGLPDDGGWAVASDMAGALSGRMTRVEGRLFHNERRQALGGPFAFPGVQVQLDGIFDELRDVAVRAAWTAAGIQLADARWATWTAEHDRFLVSQLGVLPTPELAAVLGRGEGAVRSRARKLGRRVGNAQGWPILRVARTAGISEYVLRGYLRRGELPAFKGAKCVYLDPADLVVVAEIDWQHPPAELEAAVLHALRQRLVVVLAGHEWRGLRQHAPTAPPALGQGRRSGVAGSADVLAGAADAGAANRWPVAA